MNNQESIQTNEALDQKLIELNTAIEKDMEKEKADTTQKISISKYLERADVLITIGRFDDALKDLHEALEKSGPYSMNWAPITPLYRRCDKILALSPKHLGALSLKAQSLFNNKIYDETIAVLKQVVEAQPENVAMWDLLGRAYNSTNCFSEAIQAFDRAIELSPGNKDAGIDRAIAKASLERLDEAILDLNGACSKSESEILLFLLGLLQFHKKEYQESIRVISHLMQTMSDRFALEKEIPATELEYKIVYRNKEMDISKLWQEASIMLGSAHLCNDNEKAAENCFELALCKTGTNLSEKSSEQIQLWMLYCYGCAVKRSDYNRCAARHYKDFASRFMSHNVFGKHPDLYPVLMAAYNSGNFEFVLVHVKGEKPNDKEKPMMSDMWATANWAPHALALKAFTLGQQGNMHQALTLLRDASNMFYSPDSYEVPYEGCPSRGNSLLYNQLFQLPSQNPTDFVKSLFSTSISFWDDGNMFDRGSQTEMLLQGFLLVQEGAYDKAYEKSMESESKYGKHYITSYVQGLYWQDKNTEKAIASFSESIELGNMDSHCYYNRALEYGKIGKNDEAFRDFSNAVSLKPAFARAYLERGNLLVKTGKIPEACSDYEKANSLDPSLHKQFSYEFIAQQVAEKERAIAEARVQERNKVIQDMSHSIKNLVASVVEPLNDLAAKYTDDRVVIQKALRGAELIRGTVNALNLSFKGCPEDFVQDAKAAAASDHAVSMEHLLLLSLESAVSNMFDGKYFADFCHAYFPTREAFFEAKQAFEHIQKSDDLSAMSDFLKKHMLDLEIYDEIGTKSLLLDDKRNSPLKITILLQEILLNAVKYACFHPREGRFVRISAFYEPNTIAFNINNSFVPGKSARTTRVGNEIIKNIAKLMGGSVVTSHKDTIYETILQFPNIFA